MKICLVSPPTITEFTEAHVSESDMIRLMAEHAPLGILSLSAVLEQFGIVPRIVDLNRLYYDYLGSERHRRDRSDFCGYVIATLESENCDVFGFSTICSSYPLTIRMAREVKRTHPDAAIILGGPQASVVDRQTLASFPFVDLIVRGEAEETFPLVISALAEERSYDRIPGITFRNGANVVRKPNAPVIANLDNLPLPAFHLYPQIEACHYLPLEIGRGCPFACSFCSTNDFFRRQFRLKSPDKVVQEMTLLKRLYGVERFDLIHDLFTVHRKKVVDFCHTLKSSMENFCWNCSARTDCIDDALIDLMAETGCRGIFFGIDSGSERLQEIMNKGLDLREAALRIGHSNSRGIKTAVSLITGFPEETEDDLRDTIRFLGDSLRFDKTEPQLHLLAPLAETPITTKYKEKLAFDDIFSDMSYQGWQQELPDREMIRSHPDIFPNFYAVPTLWLDRVYLKELREFILKGLRMFRWLFVALHQDCGDLLTVFDEWKLWNQKRAAASPRADGDMRGYYASNDFRDHFLEFVRSHYQMLAKYPLAISEVLNYETERTTFREACAGISPEPVSSKPLQELTLRADTILVQPSNLRITHSQVDILDLIERLREKRGLDHVREVPSTLVFRLVDDTIEILQLNQDTERLFRLCDGTHTVEKIMNTFTMTESPNLAIPAHKVSLFGLSFLHEQGLIVELQSDSSAVPN